MVDEPKELDSSSDSTQDELDLEVNQEAPTSSADSETEEDLLSVVQSAMESEEPEEAESQSEEEIEGEDDGDAEPLEASNDVENDNVSEKAPVPYKRFQEVIAEKNEFKEGAEQFTKITNYLRENNINAEEASTGLQIMALMKNDPARALEALTPFVNTLRQMTGYVLPDDIRTKVDDGYMDEDTGRELSRARAEADNQKRINDSMVAQQTNVQTAQHKEHLARTVTALSLIHI